MSAGVILRRASGISSVLYQSKGAGHDLDGMFRLARAAFRCGPRYAGPPTGNPTRYGRASGVLAARNTGRPTFTATSWVGSTTPKVPPWPEQRSITSTGVSGISFSISAALGPIFWARAWQARCTRDAFGQRRSARRQALFLRHIHHIFVDVEDMVGHAFDVLIVGQISAHSNFSISPQDAVSATMS